MALVALVVALVAIFSPGKAASAITWLVGIWLLVRGLFELVGAFSSTVSAPRWLLVLGALLDLVLGWLFVTNPGTSAVAVAVVIGILAIAWGVVFVVLALAARSATKDLPDDVSSLPPADPRRPPRPERRFGRGPPRPVRCHLTKDRRLSRAPARDRRFRESGRPAQATNTSRYAVEPAPRPAS